MDTPARPTPTDGPPRRALTAMVAAVVVLSWSGVVLGLRDWPVPVRRPGSWLVADVSGSLAALVAGSSAGCLAVAVVLTGRGAGPPWRRPPGLGWLGIALLAAGALAWKALVSAADSRTLVGAVIPVLDWLFTLLPALLAGAIAARRGAAAATMAALGTGVVTVPLLGLGWALLVSREYGDDALASSLTATALLGAAPLLVGVLLGRARARSLEERPSPSA